MVKKQKNPVGYGSDWVFGNGCPRFSRIYFGRPQAEIKSAPPGMHFPAPLHNIGPAVKSQLASVIPLCQRLFKLVICVPYPKIQTLLAVMQEKRRHQRIRFGFPPPVNIGYGGVIGKGCIENLSLSGLMVRTEMDLEAGRRIGCEFSVFGSPTIDLVATVVSKLGDLFGVRFEPGPISEILIDDAIRVALADGHASILTLHEVAGKKMMRIVGGFNGTLRNDVMHGLTKVGVDEMDLSGVTVVDQAGLALCLLAQGRYGVRIGRQSECFSKKWQEALKVPRATDTKL